MSDRSGTGAPPSHRIDAALIAAYRETDYTVDAPDGPTVLHVDAASDPLARLMRTLRGRTILPRR